MKASDLMTRDVIAIRQQTPTRDIAKLLLQHHISAAPVVDDRGVPIGMVSEGDLIGRDDASRLERRDWWLALLAEGEPLAPDFLASLPRPERMASDVMSTPVVTVDPETDAGEIARLLQTHRIKRVPVVQDGKMVGIVSRENLLHALTDEQPAHKPKPGPRILEGLVSKLEETFEQHHKIASPGAAPPAPAVVRPADGAGVTAKDFRQLVADHENKEIEHHEEERRKAAEERRRRLSELIDHHISDGAWRNILHQARTAAESGEMQALLLRFPSQLCRDGGRAINVGEPDWPATLRGEPAEVYLRWERDLKPHGFHLLAQILDFPGGIPGDAGLFLVWK